MYRDAEEVGAAEDILPLTRSRSTIGPAAGPENAAVVGAFVKSPSQGRRSG